MIIFAIKDTKLAISYKDIRSNRQWRASTGLTEAQFYKLARAFGKAYEKIHGKDIHTRHAHRANKPLLDTYEDLLFFVLYSLKTGLTFDLLALTFGLALANVHGQQQLALKVLMQALDDGGWMPKRTYESDEEFAEDWRIEASVIVDATEYRVQRAQEEQRLDYSGKKKRTP